MRLHARGRLHKIPEWLLQETVSPTTPPSFGPMPQDYSEFRYPEPPSGDAQQLRQRRALARPTATAAGEATAEASQASSSLSSLVNSVVDRHRDALSDSGESESEYPGSSASQAWSFISHGSRRAAGHSYANTSFAQSWNVSSPSALVSKATEGQNNDEDDYEIEESFLHQRTSARPDRSLRQRESSSGVLEGLLTSLGQLRGLETQVRCF